MSLGPLHLEADICVLRGKKSHVREVLRSRFAPGTIGFLTSEDGTRQEVWLVDVSVKGIGFSHGSPLEHGTPVALELKGRAGEHFAATAHVAHATQRDNGDWLIGCEFLSRLDRTLLADLIGEHPHPSCRWTCSGE